MVCLDKSHCDSGDPRDGEEGTAGRDSSLSPEDGDAWCQSQKGGHQQTPKQEGKGREGTKQRSTCARRAIDLEDPALSGSSEWSCPGRAAASSPL